MSMLPTREERSVLVHVLLTEERRTWTSKEVAIHFGWSRPSAKKALQDLRRAGFVDHVPAPEGSHFPIAGWAVKVAA